MRAGRQNPAAVWAWLSHRSQRQGVDQADVAEQEACAERLATVNILRRLIVGAQVFLVRRLKQAASAGLVALGCVSTFFSAVPAHANCLDLPNRVLIIFPEKGSSMWMMDLNRTPLAQIKLDCTLTDKEWGGLALSRHVCSDASLANPAGGQCRIMTLTPITAAPPDFDMDKAFVSQRVLN
jgi:hypothetical protein